MPGSKKGCIPENTCENHVELCGAKAENGSSNLKIGGYLASTPWDTIFLARIGGAVDGPVFWGGNTEISDAVRHALRMTPLAPTNTEPYLSDCLQGRMGPRLNQIWCCLEGNVRRLRMLCPLLPLQVPKRLLSLGTKEGQKGEWVVDTGALQDTTRHLAKQTKQGRGTAVPGQRARSGRSPHYNYG